MANTSGHDGMQPPKFRPNQSIGREVMAFPTFCNMAAVRHLEFEFCYSGPRTHEVNYAVRLPCQNLVLIRSTPPEILRFYNFASWGFLRGLNPLKLWVVIQTRKRYILWWQRVKHENTVSRRPDVRCARSLMCRCRTSPWQIIIRFHGGTHFGRKFMIFCIKFWAQSLNCEKGKLSRLMLYW